LLSVMTSAGMPMVRKLSSVTYCGL
jgi:hypothetical protein